MAAFIHPNVKSSTQQDENYAIISLTDFYIGKQEGMKRVSVNRTGPPVVTKGSLGTPQLLRGSRRGPQIEFLNENPTSSWNPLEFFFGAPWNVYLGHCIQKLDGGGGAGFFLGDCWVGGTKFRGAQTLRAHSQVTKITKFRKICQFLVNHLPLLAISPSFPQFFPL